MDEIERIKEKCIERVLDCRYEDDKVGIYIARAIQDATQHEKQRTKEALKKALYSKVTKVPVTDFQYVARRDIEQVFNEVKS